MSDTEGNAGACAGAFVPAASGVEASTPEASSHAAEASDIATKAELDHLVETRPTPAQEIHLTPDNAVSAEVNRQVAVAHESRIVDLNERLQRMRDQTERDHAFAQVNDRAKADFERAR